MKVFHLNSFPYNAPDKVGYGLQLKVASKQKELYLNSGSPLDFESWLDYNQLNYEVQLALIEAMLTPYPDSPPVMESFMAAEPQEVMEIITFFASSVPSSTSAPQGTIKSGKVSSRRQAKK